MSERQNTFVSAFHQHSPRITAYYIHEWIHETLCLRENEVAMIQMDGPRRHIYIKFRDTQKMQELLTLTKGQGEYRHTDSEISKGRIEAVGLSLRRVRRANLPPEVPDRALKMARGKYGEVRDIQEETWSRAYRYPVASDIRIAMVTLVL